jgi:CDP-glycerol glycerophosphotransferase (TagB/SpsB family)/glycosyltransferase involved in cell wall biosynthesis
VPDDRDAPAATGRRPRFSIIVPVYNVRAYLRDCLDSVLRENFGDFELIAVDDASPDGSGAMLDDYAERDDRIRVLHLEQNVGLGLARNAGLKVATGQYLLFLDSDDEMVTGALRAISDRLDATGDVDVLLFDYTRYFYWGKSTRNRLAHHLAETGPDIFSVDQRPELLTLLMVVWNKAYRRDFIAEHGFEFPPGYYEDLPWTYPALLSAEKLAVLDRVCVMYRQRWAGASILKSSGRKHFAVFDQYERVFAFLDAHPELERWRPLMFQRMIDHYATIGSSEHRLSHAERKDFFRRSADHYQRYRPDEAYAGERNSSPDWPILLQHRLWLVFAVLRLARRTRAQVVIPNRRRASERLRAGVAWTKRTAKLAYYAVQRRLPIDENLAVYGAYWFRGYSGNPAAIYAKARELVPNVRGVWVVRDEYRQDVPAGVEVVTPGSVGYYRSLARAKYFVNNVNFPGTWVKRRGATFLQTQHGTPLKTMGIDLAHYPVGAAGMGFRALMKRASTWDYGLSSNRYSTLVWEHAFPSNFESLELGYPRNDRLCNAGADDVTRARGLFDLDPAQTAVLYAPTFRDYTRGFDPPLDIGRLVDELPADHVVLLRAHYFDADSGVLDTLRGTGRLIDVSAYPRVEDLYLAADVMLTDYSSSMFDYANLDRPIVIYAPDWETYRATRGVYFDLLAEPPGLVATDEAQLAEAFTSGAAFGEPAAKLRAAFRERFCAIDDGRAAERVVRRLFSAASPDDAAG